MIPAGRALRPRLRVGRCRRRERLHPAGAGTRPDRHDCLRSPKQAGLSESANGLLRRILGRHGGLRLRSAFAVGAVATVATRWPVAFPIGVVATLGLPSLFGQTSTALSVSKLEAVATWTEMLHSTLAASAGLNQAIMATAPMSPDPHSSGHAGAGRTTQGRDVQPGCVAPVCRGGGRPEHGPCRLRPGPGTSARAQHLGEPLGALADSTREDVALRLRIETSRASPRSGIRTGSVQRRFRRRPGSSGSQLTPFGTPTGQVILVVICALYAVGLTLMVRMAKPPKPIRLLTREGYDMNVAVFCGLFFGLGVAGLIRGLRPARPLLDASGLHAVADPSIRGTAFARWSDYPAPQRPSGPPRSV